MRVVEQVHPADQAWGPCSRNDLRDGLHPNIRRVVRCVRFVSARTNLLGLCGLCTRPKLPHVDDEKTNEPNAPETYVPAASPSTSALTDARAAPVEMLRAALRLRIEHTSLRSVAREVGMSLGGFHGFLAGTDAHPATLRKVRAWYVRESARQRAGSGPPADDATAAAALAVLLEEIPPDARLDAAEALRTRLLEWCRDRGLRVPSWGAATKSPDGDANPGEEDR